MTENTSIQLGGVLFLQTLLLVLHYGFELNMPLWVTFFPFLISGGIILFIILMIILNAI